MKTTENERVKLVVYWLISQSIVASQEDAATKLGYNAAYLSQVITGVKPVSQKLIKNLCKLSQKINEIYLFDGNGKMILDDSPVVFSSTKNLTEAAKDDIIAEQNKKLDKMAKNIEYLNYENDRMVGLLGKDLLFENEKQKQEIENLKVKLELKESMIKTMEELNSANEQIIELLNNGVNANTKKLQKSLQKI
ncbi:hypothetical protein FACS1894156_8080 [Bacteroidia bacterium]|nr:hypothetical protein FACS1894156_8080 [Bacteroidia bacterium]